MSELRNSIVGILSKSSSYKYAGTGFFVSGGLILTCAHVLDEARELNGHHLFCFDGDEKWYHASVIFKKDVTEQDIAILKPIDLSEAAPALPLVTSRDSQGRDFQSFGYPFEGNGQGLYGDGKILNWVSDSLRRDVLQIESDEITHGFSGCPVWDIELKGVVGMVSRGFDFGLDKKLGKVAFAIPSETLKNAYSDLVVNQAALPEGKAPLQISIDGHTTGNNIIAGDNNLITVVSGHQTSPAIHQLPAPPADFVGRAEAMARILQHEHTAISGFSGLGGVGKTALALMVAAQLAEKYPDAQFFLDLEGVSKNPLTPQDAMRYVIQGFEPDANMSVYNDDNLVGGQYHSLLRGKRALLFFDNARDAAQVRPLLPPPGNAFLLTSRAHFTLAGMDGPMRLDVLPEAETRQLLDKICPRIGENVPEIAQLCGRLPLALRIAATFLVEHPGWTPAEYIERLKSQRLKTLKTEDDPDEDVEGVFEMSYAQLNTSEQKIWRALGIFTAPFTRAALAAVCALDDDSARDFAGKVQRMSLLEFNAEQGRYFLHDLLRDFATARLDSQEGFDARSQHARFFMDVAKEANNLYLQGGENVLRGLKLFDSEWAHLRAAQAWAAQNVETGAAEFAMRLPDAGIYCLELRLAPRHRIDWLESALRAARFLKDREGEGKALENLGNAYEDLGEARRAIEFYEQSLTITREIGDRRGEGSALDNLGNAHADLGASRRAIEFYEQSLAIAREIGDRRGEGIALGNLGVAYANLGAPRRAIEFYDQSLAIAREIGDRRGEGTMLGSLGAAYADLGAPRRAIEFYEQSLAITCEIGDRRSEGTTLGNLGTAYSDLGEARRAIEFQEQSLAITREIGDRRSEGNTLDFLGAAYGDLGETRHAIEFQEQYLAITRELGDRRGEGTAVGRLGAAYAALGETRRAIEFYEQSLVIVRELGDRISEWATLNNLGNTYADLGETNRAIEFYEQGLVIVRELGNRHDEGTTLGNLGTAYSDLGEPRRTIEFQEQSLVIARELGDQLGEWATLNNLGNAYSDLGETYRAIEFYEQSLAIARELGNRHDEWTTLGNLGTAYADLGETRRAIEFYEQSLVIVRELGDRISECATLNNLGNTYADLGETNRAIEFYEQGLVIVRELGNRHDEGTTLGNLGTAYADLGETRRAIEFYEQSLVIVRELGDRHDEMTTLGNLENAYTALGETRRAIEFQEQSLAIARELGDQLGEGDTLNNLGNAYADLGEIHRAIEFYEQSLAITHKLGDQLGEWAALNNLGISYRDIGDIARAQQLGQQALEICLAVKDPNAEITTRKWLEELP